MELRIKERLENYKRVLTISKKPSIEEFKSIAKICALGMFIVGIIGFIMYVISVLFMG